MLLMMLLPVSALRAELKEGEQLLPELGIYVDINEEEWGAAKVNLRLYNNSFQLFFLDSNDLLVTPPIDDAIVHYSNFIKKSQAESTITLKKNGMMLSADRVIPPPARYQVRVFLRKWVQPAEYYKEAYEEKEFIGLHMLNQLGEQFAEANTTAPYSKPVPTEESEVSAADAKEAAPSPQ